MMHIESYHLIAGWVIWQMILSILILPVLLILLRNKFYPQRQRLFLITKRIQIVVIVIYLISAFYETNRYGHFIEFNKKITTFGPYKLPSGKLITPTTAFVDGDPKERRSVLIKYESELKASDTLSLKEEILYIWDQVVIDADKEHANYAFISANPFPEDEAKMNRNGFTIFFSKDYSGSWVSRALPNQRLKLTE
jgi:hypothetical protein